MDVQALKSNIKQILSNNKDGHLDLHECMVLLEVLDLLNHPTLNPTQQEAS